MKNNMFANIQLPMQLMTAVDGAEIKVIQEAPIDVLSEPFFGGFAEDLLADMGFDVADEATDKAARAKRV